MLKPTASDADPNRSGELFPVSAAAEQRIDRRRFLCAAGCAAVLVATGEWLAHRAGAVAPERVDLPRADAEGLAAGEARSVSAPGGGEALVVRLDAGTLVAFDRRCPHLGCPVIWAAERGRFECPCHHAAFDARTGAVLFGPPRRGLTPAAIG